MKIKSPQVNYVIVMKKHLIFIRMVLMICCGTSMQAQIDNPSRVYDIVTDTDTFYLFPKPKPCFDGVFYWAFTPVNRMLQEYVVHDMVTVYGVAITFENELGPLPVDDSSFQACLYECIGHSFADRNTQFYEFQPVDTVTLNRSHPRFCFFLYEDSCDKANTFLSPCYEFYFDTPEQINCMTGTFYVGRYMNVDMGSPSGISMKEYGARYDNSLPGHIYLNVGMSQDISDHYILDDWQDNKRWGWAFPIIGFRCGPIQHLFLDAYTGDSAVVRWRQVEEGTLYNVRLTGEDGSDTAFVTADTSVTFSSLSDSVRYTAMVRKQCHYATSNYDTTVYGEWKTVSFGTTVVGPPDDSVGIMLPEVDGFSLHPNPTSGTVLLTAESELTGVEVYTADGVPFLRLSATGRSAQFDTSTWPAGTYMVRVLTADGVTTQRIVVTR